MLKSGLLLSLVLVSVQSFAQEAVVDVSLKPAGSFRGKTTELKGFATVKGDSVEAKDIVVDLRHLETGIELRDEHTRKHLDVTKFPQAVLVSATGKGGVGEGLIRIRGVEKKINGNYELDGKKLIAKFKLKLSDFNITGIRYMGVGVADEVSLVVQVLIKK
ncbi:MAG: hypothetical protein BroJett040_17040 [Oligoflexia bacterium]|nr:MAG: hypothetical protein BroJett040_17040 [Oligoflexia bacterium]